MSEFRDDYVASSIIKPSTAARVQMANSLLADGIIETPKQYVEYIETGSFTPIKMNIFQKIIRFIKGRK